MKTCFRCKNVQEYAQFQRDCTSKDGYRSSCKTCLKARNMAPLSQKPPSHGFTTKCVSSDPKPKVTITQENPYERLSRKYGAFYTLAIESNGMCRLQIFGDGVPKVFKADNFNVEGLLERVA